MKKRKLKRLNYKNIFKLIFFILIFSLTIVLLKSINITNIYINGNNYYSDSEIIKLAKIEDYPNAFVNSSWVIKNRLENNGYIISAKVYKKWFTSVYIEVTENYPLFYDTLVNKTIMYDGIMDGDLKGIPYLINKIPTTIYYKFENGMRNLDKNVIPRISEVKYDPSDVDDQRFLITTNDGNYIYINLKNIDKLNLYPDLLKSVGNKKGIFYLDSGEYFKIMEE